jgi:hypothetical protein
MESDPRVYVSFDDEQELDRAELEEFFRHFDEGGRLTRRSGRATSPDDLAGTLDEYDVLLVLVGRTTAVRRVIDWELREALSKRSDGGAPLGVLACTIDRNAELSRTPARLGRNVESGYARLYRWPLGEDELWAWIRCAAAARATRADLIDNDAEPQAEDGPLTDTWTW